MSEKISHSSTFRGSVLESCVPSHGEQVLPSERGARYDDEGFEAFGAFDVRYNNGRMVSR